MLVVAKSSRDSLSSGVIVAYRKTFRSAGLYLEILPIIYLGCRSKFVILATTKVKPLAPARCKNLNVTGGHLAPGGISSPHLIYDALILQSR